MEENVIKVTTAYNVEIEYSSANVWDRVLAYLLDSLIKGAYLSFVFALIFSAMGIFNGWVIGISLIPFLFYSLFFELFNNGKTPGKSIMKIQVVSLTGKNTTTGQIVLRWFARMLDFSLFSPGVAFLSVMASLKGQRVGDLLANTAVISHKEREAHRSTLSRVKIPAGYVGKYREVLRLKDHEISTLKAVIYNDTPAKHEIQSAAAERIMDYTGIPKVIPARMYLKMIIYDYNYFQRLDNISEEE